MSLDYSNNKNDIYPSVAVGPSMISKGQSAYFDGSDFRVLDHIEAYE
jgi:hypothetical protein